MIMGMQRRRHGAIIAFLVTACLPLFAGAALPVADSQGSPLPTLAPMLERVTPAVVNIATRGTVRVRDNPLMLDPFFQRFFGMPERPKERTTQSLGSGVVVDARNGYVLTNNHVIDKADEIAVTLRDGRTLTAKLVGTDPEADVAVVQIPAENLTAVSLADSSALRVGDFVVAIGNPFGLGQTVTSGIVSALGRSGLGIEGYEDFIQTDASINPGNSGGALVNLSGELVGINTAILAPGGGNVGIGFAIPVNMTEKIMAQLVAHGEVRRGVVGIAAQDLTVDLARAFNLSDQQGAVVVRVVENSPASRAGLQVGDVVTAVDGRKIASSAELRNAIGLMAVGDNAQISYLREGRAHSARVSIEPPRKITLDGESVDPRLAGALLEQTEGGARGDKPAGILVAKIAARSPAAATGLQPGDLIVSVNRRQVTQVKELQALASGARRLLLNIRRGDAGLFLLLE
jgi:serine protease Do/serine protease DegQ